MKVFPLVCFTQSSLENFSVLRTLQQSFIRENPEVTQETQEVTLPPALKKSSPDFDYAVEFLRDLIKKMC